MLTVLALFAACKPRVQQDIHALSDPDSATTSESAAARAARDAAVSELAANFSRVHFETDSAALTPASRGALEANAVLLAAHRDVRVEVQGHADERGTVDYNLALGLQRARAVVAYLLARGVPPSRLQITTYGEEQPLANASTAVAWAENRRAEFRVTSGTAVRGTTN